MEERLSLVERDSRSHARSLTEMTRKINSIGDSFSEKQLGQLHDAFADVLAAAGLRIDDADHIDDAREDFRFVRRLRLNWDGLTKQVGSWVLLAVLGVVGTIVGLGFWAWIKSAGH